MTSETSFNEIPRRKGHGVKSLINKSGLEPRGHAVLIKPYELESTSLIVIPDSVKERNKMIESRAIVIDAGSAAWDDEDEPRAMPGDKVMVARYTGNMVQGTLDGETYRMINDRDIYCRIVEEK